MNSPAKNKKSKRRRLTVPKFIEKKQKGEKITMLTAYDHTMASLLDEAGVDTLLVGDSMAMVVQGHDTTLPVTLDEIIYHAEMVGRAAKHALVIVDMPFPINHQGVYEAVKAAGRILKQTGCQAVKLEGGAEQSEVINALVTAGIPVMAHVGLRPQAVHTMGGYKVQRDRETILADAKACEAAGAFGIVLECIPSDIAKAVTEQLVIPTIGIGAGPDCDGQVLVINDMLGLTSGYVPSFVKAYANLKETIQGAAKTWCNEVREKEFPGEEHSF
ncbi:MAG: 3-methyl-2-oxobutanoate hydroxymethyltransferase [Mariniblastus sp.]